MVWSENQSFGGGSIQRRSADRKKQKTPQKHKNTPPKRKNTPKKAQRHSQKQVAKFLSITTFPPYLLRWTSSFARDDGAQQERRNGFSAIATMLPLFSSLCVSFCSAAVRGARAPRGRRQAGLLLSLGFRAEGSVGLRQKGSVGSTHRHSRWRAAAFTC